MVVMGRQIAAARELLKMSRAELAEAADIGVSSGYRLEEERSEPHRATLNAIVAVLEKREIIFTNGDRPGVAIERSRLLPPGQAGPNTAG